MFGFTINSPTVNTIEKIGRFRSNDIYYSETRLTESAPIAFDAKTILTTSSLGFKKPLLNIGPNDLNDRIGSVMSMRNLRGNQKIKRISAKITFGQKRLKINTRDI